MLLVNFQICNVNLNFINLSGNIIQYCTLSLNKQCLSLFSNMLYVCIIIVQHQGCWYKNEEKIFSAKSSSALIEL